MSGEVNEQKVIEADPTDFHNLLVARWLFVGVCEYKDKACLSTCGYQAVENGCFTP